MRLKNVAIPNIRHSCFLNSVYVGNFNLKSKKNIVVDKIKQTKVYSSMIIFTDIHLCLLLVCRELSLLFHSVTDFVCN